MAYDRIALLPENQFATDLKQLAADLENIKGRQQHSGKSGLLGYLTDSGLTWDKHETVVSPGPGSGLTAEFEVIFTASGKQPYPFEQPYATLLFGTNAANNTINRLSGFWSDGVNSVSIGNFLTFDKSYSNNQTTYRWQISFIYFGTVEYFLKAYAVGSSDGSLVVNRLS